MASAAIFRVLMSATVQPLLRRWGLVDRVVYMYNMLYHFLPYLLLCWFATRHNTHSSMESVLSILSVVLGELLGVLIKGMRLPNTVPQLIAWNSRVASACKVEPRIRCSSCNTVYRFDECVLTDDDGRPVSKVCDHQEFPKHPHIKGRLTCNKALFAKIVVRNLNGKEELRLHPYPEHKFYYMGTFVLGIPF